MSNNDLCGSTNPMAQMLKRFGRDQSLQRDHFEGPSQSFSGSSMRTQKPGSSFVQRDESMKKIFFGEKQLRRSQADNAICLDNNFKFSGLQYELSNVRQTNEYGDWVSEFKNVYQSDLGLRKLAPSEVTAMEKIFMESNASTGSARNASVWGKEFMSHPKMINIDPTQLAEFEAAFQKHSNWINEFDLQVKGREPILLNNNATWEEHFSMFDNRNEIEHDTAQKNEETITKDSNEDIWQGTSNQLLEGNNWENEFGSFSDSGIIRKPDLGEYIFEAANPFLSHPDPISEGLQLLNEGYSLTDAALAFEAAVQKDPEDSQAWMSLGNVQAQNEKETPAIRALERAVKVDPSNLDALLSLSVSYINEAFDQAACQTLERWITQKYPSVLNGQTLPEKISPFDMHERAINLFLTIARQAPDVKSMDPDVQVGLGILFYGNGDLGKAADCFISALKSRPDDYLLWNRMGATMANDGRPEEAIDAYHKALEIRPSFVRARYNLGVSCINIGCYKEAAEHILTGISMHKRGHVNGEEGINVSNKSWDMLRKAFVLMNRCDLAEKAVAGADLNQFRPEFEF